MTRCAAWRAPGLTDLRYTARVSTLSTILHDVFGHDALYPIQEQIIGAVRAGEHAMAVLPTGGGKSLCYQLPAVTHRAEGHDGTCLVFSPLIALMEDQVAALKKKGVRAEYINSTLRKKERLARYEALGEGAYDLIYATPERMEKPEFREALRACPGGVHLLAIDEAHCITQWGHDFRPAYQRVGEFREWLGSPRTIALTATATPMVRTDIRATLGMSDAQLPLYSTPIDRPNLQYEMQDVWDDADKVRNIIDVRGAMTGTGIVYFALIKDLERTVPLVTGALKDAGVDASIEIYHGKLDPREKKRVYQRFITASPDENLILLATNAFGMGVDKPDIRFIIHAQIPGSVEAWTQEIGRAGRDGEPSVCRLLYSQDDLAVQQQFIEWSNPSADMLMSASVALERTGDHDFDVDELRDQIIRRNRGDRRAEYTLITLAKLGIVEETFVPGRYRFLRPLEDHEVDPADIDAKKQRDLKRLLDMVTAAKAEDLRAAINGYFELG